MKLPAAKGRTSKRAQFFLLFFLLSTVFYPSICIAEDVLVNLKAENLKYDEDQQIVTATGLVEIKLEDIYIKADTVKVNTKTGVATAEGNVEINRDRYTANCSSITYDVSSEVTNLKDVSTVITSKNVKGKVFLACKEATENKEITKGDEGSTTTCDYLEPHYHVKAARFEYYPEDKIVCYSVTFYIGKMPVMWMPYFIYYINEKRASRMPVFGHNQVEGDFLKTSWDYFINNSSHGTIFLDSMERKGFGHGFEHQYKLNKYNEGKFYLYHLNEKFDPITDWVARLNHTFLLSDKSKLSVSHDYADIYLIPSGRMDRTQSKLDFNYDGISKINIGFDHLDDRNAFWQDSNLRIGHRIGEYNSNYLLSYSRGRDAPYESRLNERLTHEQPFVFENSTIATTFNYYRNSSGEVFPSDERLEPEVVMRQKGDFYSIKIRQNWYLDLDNKAYLADNNDEYVEAQPETEVAFKPLNWNNFSISNNCAWGRYHEVKYVSATSQMRHFTTNRSKVGTDIRRVDQLAFGTTTILSFGADQFLYGPGDSRYALREGLGVNTMLGGFFKNSVNYNRGLSEGNTPFFFDNIGNNYNNVKDTATFYYGDRVIWNTDGGYNFQTEKYFDVLTNLTVKPNERLRLYLAGGYDIENQKYRDLVTGTSLIPMDGVIANLNSVHDLNTGTLKSMDSLLDLQIGSSWQEKWHFRMGHVYDFFTQRFLLRELMLVKDLHCWEVKFVYNDYSKQYLLSFTLKAFPGQPFGVSSTSGFYFEGFQDELMKESPRRY